MRMAAVFTLWSFALTAAAIGSYLNTVGRHGPAILALVVCVAAFHGMFVIGRRGSASP